MAKKYNIEENFEQLTDKFNKKKLVQRFQENRKTTRRQIISQSYSKSNTETLSMSEQSTFSSQFRRQKAFKFTKQDETESEKSEESINTIAPL